jgi:DnaK suppressor protein
MGVERFIFGQGTMNATVTKTAKKSAPAKSAGKVAAKAKPATKSAAVKKPAAKPAPAAKKVAPAPAKKVAAKKPVPAATVKAKAAPAMAGKVAPKIAGKVNPPAVVQNSKTSAGKAAKVTKKVDNTPEKLSPTKSSVNNSKAVKSDASMSANNAADVFMDKIQKTVVSKVSEVATKTTKPTPASAAGEGNLLTEEQILKMGEKDYMNAAQLAFFKQRLQQLEKDLLRNAGETTEHLRETVLVPDPADRATIEEEHALELRTRDRERKLLKKVQQSIHSIDAGDYGWCEETGEPIGVARLLARPTATLSLEAQQRRELKQKLYGD